MKVQKNETERLSIKQVVFAALLFMLVGMGLELYLLSHYEDTLQIIPLFCIGSALLVISVLLFRQSTFVLGLFKGVLGITALSGFYGTFLHLRANYEFEKEMKPSAHDWDLFLESLSGALPALAPGSMILLALIGYSYIILLKQKQ